MLRNFIYNYENDKPSRFIPYLKKVRSDFFFLIYLLSAKAHGDVSDLKSLSFVSPRNSTNQKQFSLVTYRFPRWALIASSVPLPYGFVTSILLGDSLMFPTWTRQRQIHLDTAWTLEKINPRSCAFRIYEIFYLKVFFWLAIKCTCLHFVVFVPIFLINARPIWLCLSHLVDWATVSIGD